MKYCKSNLYAFGVSEHLPNWEWADQKLESLKHITGLGNIVEFNQKPENKTPNHPTTVKIGNKYMYNQSKNVSLSKIEEEDHHGDSREVKKPPGKKEIFSGTRT